VRRAEAERVRAFPWRRRPKISPCLQTMISPSKIGATASAYDRDVQVKGEDRGTARLQKKGGAASPAAVLSQEDLSLLC
jgi:hypothetical protein